MSEETLSEAESLARRWIEVWGRDDPRTLPLAETFVHVSPFGRLEGRSRYLEVVMPMAQQNVASLRITSVISEGNQACIAFTMDTPRGPIPCCDWVTVADGEILSVHSYYDSRNLPNFDKY